MELKTYQARSMSEALNKVRSELGRQAVILHTRNLKRGGLFGIGAHSLVEITATVDPRPTPAPPTTAQPAAREAPARGSPNSSRRPAPGPRPPQQTTADRPTYPPTNQQTGPPRPEATQPPAPDPTRADAPTPRWLSNIARQTRSSRLEDRQPESPAPPMPPAADPVLRSEIKEIRDLVTNLLQKTEQPPRPQLPAELLDHYTRLVSQDVAEEVAVQLLDRVAVKLQDSGTIHWDHRGRLVGGDTATPDWIRNELQQAVVDMLPPSRPLELSANGQPTVVALVGPTGVGKTTTIAKLAANMKLREGKSVGLITIDTYRIAAVEQLKTYAEILQVNLKAVTTPQEMQPAVRQMADQDLILIDTAGRSHKDEMRIAELGRFLAAARPDQVHLVLSSTSTERAIRETITNFSVLRPQHLILTKLDEAVGFGVILNVLRSVDLRLSYLTNGQSVPADIEPATPRRVAQLILASGAQSNRVLHEPVPPTCLATSGRGD